MANIDDKAAEIWKGLKKYWGSIGELSEILGVNRTTLYRHLKGQGKVSMETRLNTLEEACKLIKKKKEEGEEKTERIANLLAQAT